MILKLARYFFVLFAVSMFFSSCSSVFNSKLEEKYEKKSYSSEINSVFRKIKPEWNYCKKYNEYNYLSWYEVSGAVKYEIYLKSNFYVYDILIKTTSDTFFYDTKYLDEGSYYIVALNENNEESLKSDVITF